MKSQKISVQCCCLVVSDSCDLMDWHEVAMRQPGSLPGFSVHGISQARILEGVAISFSRGSPWSRDLTRVSYTGRQSLYHIQTWRLLGSEV